MNERIDELLWQAGGFTKLCYPNDSFLDGRYALTQEQLDKFAELIVEEVLDQVKERAYYTGDRDWSDDVDRPWIQLEFGYGVLHDAKTFSELNDEQS